MFPADEKFQAQLAAKGVKAMLAEVCGLRPGVDDAVIDEIVKLYDTGL